MANTQELHPRHVNIAAAAYELEPAVVVDDIAIVFDWREPADELIVWLSHEHNWEAEMAVSYLTHLHQAVRAAD